MNPLFSLPMAVHPSPLVGSRSRTMRCLSAPGHATDRHTRCARHDSVPTDADPNTATVVPIFVRHDGEPPSLPAQRGSPAAGVIPPLRSRAGGAPGRDCSSLPESAASRIGRPVTRCRRSGTETQEGAAAPLTGRRGPESGRAPHHCGSRRRPGSPSPCSRRRCRRPAAAVPMARATAAPGHR